MGPFGFYRVAAVSPAVVVANPTKNGNEILPIIAQLSKQQVDLVLFPELCITGYTCADLFANRTLQIAAKEVLQTIVASTAHSSTAVVVGLPWLIEDSLYNVAAVIHAGQLKGVVPKRFLPNYREFYESRWFRPADGLEIKEIDFAGETVPFGIDLLFAHGQAVIGVEICEDLWVPIPPSSRQALAGANVLVNLSAGNEIVGKSDWRRNLVVSQSGRCIAAYAYANAGPGESTTDLVFGGHCLIAENGTILDQSRRIGDGDLPWQGEHWIISDVDLDRLSYDRSVQSSFSAWREEAAPPFRHLRLEASPLTESNTSSLHRFVDAHPFVPHNMEQRESRCAEIFGIQTAALAKRVGMLSPTSPLVIGVSGGLDSTLALLAAVKACDQYHWPRTRILGITMPGFGTSAKTLKNAHELMDELGITKKSVDIRLQCWETFRAMQHAPLGIEITDLQLDEFIAELSKAPQKEDLVFENVQARTRTLLLMSHGFVLGTGDLSEQALGWSTYNGDHMSMYNVNTSVPKTLVRFLVTFAADRYFEGALRETLHSIAATPISPELLPLSGSGEIQQNTEETLGAYELHDFFLYHFVRFGSTREKILFLASLADFSVQHSPQAIGQAYQTFIKRFFANQFKRSCVPDGPKVGSVSLSPRGDWRMPSDGDCGSFL